MPKEKISDHVIDGWFAEVTWCREEHVCGCGAVWSTDGPDECPECGFETVYRHGHVQLASVNPASPFSFPAGPNETDEPFDGWRVTLDADQIDYLILVLRKARRQAFPKHHSAHCASESVEPTVVNVIHTTPDININDVNRAVNWTLRGI